ncbi:MAG: hypothetical protein KDA89_10045 [Planctomycetaceae bacterium]|nr:hypothetical protein [Planctomycetaceae bacterium]
MIDTILKFSFPLGRLAHVRVRMSFLLPVAFLAITWRLGSLAFGLAASAVLLFSVLAHELSHLLMSRLTGAQMDEINLWPFGGLEEPYGRGRLSDHLRTLAAGPVTNLALAVSCMAVLTPDQVSRLLSPFVEFTVPNNEPMITTVWRLMFTINWVLFAVNLLPVVPFDSGVLLRTYLMARFSEAESRDLMVRLGLILGLFGVLTGFVFDLSSLLAIAGFILILHLRQAEQWYEALARMHSVDDYDYAESFTDNSWQIPERDAVSGSVVADDSENHSAWQSQRETDRLHSEQEQRLREEQDLDNVLRKLHVHGRESLNHQELHLLQRLSDRYRNGRRPNDRQRNGRQHNQH